MKTATEITNTQPQDKSEILELYRSVFIEEDLTPLVKELLEKKTGTLSLIARSEGEMAGHICFTNCRVEGAREPVALLGPLAVPNQRQKQGIGLALIKEGLKYLEAEDIAIVFVLGDPAYYSRSGFQPETNIIPPYPLPDEWQGAWQSRSLVANGKAPQGKLLVPDVWMKKALWTD